ncbi:MAG: adenine deaminase [Planctomycetota bacterium]
MSTVRSQLVDIDARAIRPVEIRVSAGRIDSIETLEKGDVDNTFIVPGFVDAHVHIESSMLTPSQFAAAAVIHGTVATVSDPHEIANVLGLPGVRYMLDDASRVPFKFLFGAPSCVPATVFETAGASISPEETAGLLDDDRIGYLAEMMNFPGVLQEDPDVLAKIEAARQRGKPIDGHAPGLRGDDVSKYFAAGITTDHECTQLDEAIEKLAAGAMIQIREGSAARNFDALYPLIDQYPGRVAFCSDDKHPDELVSGHINALCRRAVGRGCDLFHVLTAACIVPVRHYRLDVGQCRVGDRADFVELESLETFDVRRTIIDGDCVSEAGRSLITVPPAQPMNQFRCGFKRPDQFKLPALHATDMRVIVAEDRLLTTRSETVAPTVVGGSVVADPDRDLLKLTVVNRYADADPAVALVRSFGLSRGALAGSVGHDSHNILGVGADDESLCEAVNAIIGHEGGLAVVDGQRIETLPLPVAGLMSTQSCDVVAARYQEIDTLARQMGCTLQAPFMTLSFMALLVIPSLKLSDLGLFDGDRFQLVDHWSVP